MYLCPARSHRLPRKNPVDDFSLLEEGVRFRRRMAIRQSILEIRTIERVGGRAGGCIEIEVPADQSRRSRPATLRVRENFVKLRATQAVIAPALEMKVVRDYGPVSDFYLALQREPSSDALLKRWNIRKEPVGPPEIRLLLEADDPAVG